MPDSGRDSLRGELRRLRVRASLSQRAMGVALGGSQMKCARVESGETLLSVQDTARWLDAVAAVPGVLAEGDRARLLDLAETVQATARGWDDVLGEVGHAQRTIADRERESLVVRTAQPTLVPGLLQTPETAVAIFGLGQTRDVLAAVAARIERQKLLYEPGRKFQFLVAEQALRVPFGGEEVAAAQRDRVVSLARLAAVEVGVLPADRVVAAVWHDFTLWTLASGGPVEVSVELIDGEQVIRDPERVARYEAMWARLWSAAITDPEEIDQFVRAIR